MTHIPTAKDLLLLEARLEGDGFSEHDFTIIHLVSVAESIGVPSRLTRSIADTSMPEMTRRRAVGRLAEVWSGYTDNYLDNDRDRSNSFTKLLSAWRAHQDLRKQDVSVADLFASRTRLDEARTTMARNSLRSGCGLSPC